MRAVRVAVACLCFMLGVGCKPTEQTATPAEPGRAQPEALTELGDQVAKIDSKPIDSKPIDSKPLPTVRDRDPEEEKKKLAQSHKRSDQALKTLRAGRLQSAASQARAALKIHEQNVAAMLVLAEIFYRQGKYELTLAVGSSALTVDEKIRTPSETSRAHNLRGFAHAAMGNDVAATQAFKKAAEADDKNAAAWNNLGTRYLSGGDANTAASCFQYALELKPRFAKAHLNLGAALRAQGKVADAERSILKALKLKPNYAEAYFTLGVLYLDADPFPGLDTTKRLNKAIAALTRYRDLTGAGGSGSPRRPGAGVSGTKNRRVAMGKPAGTGPPVSRARADDYIRVAKKGIDREKRRSEREHKRKASTESKPSEPKPSEPEPTEPEPTAPASETTPTKPDDEASPKRPQKPTQPAPGPDGHKPQAPRQPGVQKPSVQKPGVKKPGNKKRSSAWNPLGFCDTNPKGSVVLAGVPSSWSRHLRAGWRRGRRPNGARVSRGSGALRGLPGVVGARWGCSPPACS